MGNAERTIRVHMMLPANRNYVGELRVWGENGRVLLGPTRVAARAADELAADHGNPTRASTLPFGDAPLGSYKFERLAATGAGTKYRSDLFGDLDVIVLSGRDGDAALADANGRFEFLIHGGPLSADGALRATAGHFRVSDEDLERLHDLLAGAARVTVECEESQRPERVELVEDRRGRGVDFTEQTVPRPMQFASPQAYLDIVAYGEYGDPPSPDSAVWGAKASCEVRMADGSIKTIDCPISLTYTQENASVQATIALDAAVKKSGGVEIKDSVKVQVVWHF